MLIIESLQQLEIARVGLVEIYDPVFGKADRLLLETVYKFKIPLINDKCVRQVELSDRDNCLSFIYMPHCPKALYNNLLYANWSRRHLKCIILFGNSFGTIQTLTIEKNLCEFYGYIRDGLRIFKEVKLDHSCDLTNAFYDLNFQLFDRNFHDHFSLINEIPDFKVLDSSLESKHPVYDENEEIL